MILSFQMKSVIKNLFDPEYQKKKVSFIKASGKGGSSWVICLL